MMIECMAGKSASMHGLCHDATPFTFAEDKPAIDHFGQLLTKGSFYLIIAVLSYNIISMPWPTGQLVRPVNWCDFFSRKPYRPPKTCPLISVTLFTLSHAKHQRKCDFDIVNAIRQCEGTREVQWVSTFASALVPLDVCHYLMWIATQRLMVPIWSQSQMQTLSVNGY